MCKLFSPVSVCVRAYSDCRSKRDDISGQVTCAVVSIACVSLTTATRDLVLFKLAVSVIITRRLDTSPVAQLTQLHAHQTLVHTYHPHNATAPPTACHAVNVHSTHGQYSVVRYTVIQCIEQELRDHYRYGSRMNSRICNLVVTVDEVSKMQANCLVCKVSRRRTFHHSVARLF